MEIRTKQVLLSIITAVICIVAGIVIYRSVGDKDRFSDLAGEKMWVKCSNTACAAEYETDQASFFRELEKKGPMAQSINCQKCNKPTAMAAIKCPKCKNVFYERSAGPADYPDRCPKCNFSETESRANTAK